MGQDRVLSGFVDKTTRETSKVELQDLFSLCSLPCKAGLNMKVLVPQDESFSLSLRIRATGSPPPGCLKRCHHVSHDCSRRMEKRFSVRAPELQLGSFLKPLQWKNHFLAHL